MQLLITPKSNLLRFSKIFVKCRKAFTLNECIVVKQEMLENNKDIIDVRLASMIHHMVAVDYKIYNFFKPRRHIYTYNDIFGL